ncbi:N-acetyl-1-D-myo-inositol-2-amino-2-deoxy-alpha-D-glucopyranoside deacetylase [Nakamurella deserti]|uniref:N-acetyl-1-D-myo-inositol-2-amino-2-deoxy-alpha- D-glucopyranoside deacetylase n=1 Tax=Nakamurella deserti TaxID=2164074 RepID=UPI000DBE8DE4|nr:N-acetyl-1-D-myo-inositol-2-amino-2-deoxy-alpha-D-glucopyranoside deacetylase [Nakamurella deserti]
MSHRLLAVHAHPDDESITMGGTLARHTAAGDRVTLVTCTLGEEGEIIPPHLAQLAADRADQLGGYRHGELEAACRALGVVDHRYLGGIGGHRDSGMAGSPAHRHPRALVHAAAGAPGFEAAVGELLAVLDELAPEVVLSYDADGGYGHPDHIAAHQIAREAARRAGSVRRFFAVVRPADVVRDALAGFVPAAGYTAPVAADLGFAVTADRVDVAVPVVGLRARHRAALAAHATQIDLLPDGFALSNRIAQPVLDVEYFSLLDGEPLPAGPAGDDLFAGLA